MPAKCNSTFTVTIHETDHIGTVAFVIDHDKGMSVTNDAENVVQHVVETYGDFRIFYQDSQHEVDEIVHENGRFKRFDLIGAHTLSEAISFQTPPKAVLERRARAKAEAELDLTILDLDALESRRKAILKRIDLQSNLEFADMHVARYEPASDAVDRRFDLNFEIRMKLEKMLREVREEIARRTPPA